VTSRPAPPPVLHNDSLHRFETQSAGTTPAFLSYTREEERVILEHTFVPDEFRGRGLAATLVRAALDEARRQHWRIVPRCTYVAGFIEQNQEFADLIDRQE